MYAVFETGAKQYRVSAGDVIRIEKIAGSIGDEVRFGNVVVFSEEGAGILAGTPYLDATVNATIVGAGRGEKVIVFKFKSKKDYRKKQGHRQPYTEIEIDNFTVGGKDFGEKSEKPKAAAKEAAPDEETAPVKDAEQAEDEVSAVGIASVDDAATEAEAAKPDDAADAPVVAEAKSGAKLTKADIMEKLDALGVPYAKSAKKDELLGLLDEAEGK